MISVATISTHLHVRTRLEVNPGDLDGPRMQGQGLSSGVKGEDHAELLDGGGVDAVQLTTMLLNCPLRY
jgi:hypothetical protein